MKKIFKFYVAAWTVMFALFQVVSFVSVGWAGIEKYTPSFWIGYLFITISFIGQLACAYFAFKCDDSRKAFYQIPLVTISYTGLILSFVFGGVCMLISKLPYWVGVILCASVLALNIISVMKAFAAAELAGRVDDKAKAQTFFIKSLTADAEGLALRAKSEAVKKECGKIYEAVRYSDPVSQERLAGIEQEISAKFAAFTKAVDADHALAAEEISNELIVLIHDRNEKCRLLKEDG